MGVVSIHSRQRRSQKLFDGGEGATKFRPPHPSVPKFSYKNIFFYMGVSYSIRPASPIILDVIYKRPFGKLKKIHQRAYLTPQFPLWLRA